MTLLYAGQEVEDEHLPSLFEKDPVQWNSGRDLSALLRRLYMIKKKPIFTDIVTRYMLFHTMCFMPLIVQVTSR
jgi:hypothetical protein